jgi:hypothetical protein
MNTPEPCCRCTRLYYDAMTKNDENGYVECKAGKEIGNMDCSSFDEWESDSDLICANCGIRLGDHNGECPGSSMNRKSNPKDLTELMRLVWESAEKAEDDGNVRDAYLLTVAGNIIEGTYTTESKSTIIERSIANAEEIFGIGNEVENR